MTIDYSKFNSIVDSDDEKEKAESKSAATAKAPVPVEKPRCYNCHNEVEKPLRCGVCKKASYCSSKCQREDWPYHKRGCKKPEEKPAAKKDAPAAPKAGEAKRKEEKKEEKEGRRKEEEKITENDEDLKWYKHREWRPTEEPKKEFAPTRIGDTAETAVGGAAEVSKPQVAGSAWNAAGTWEEKDVTEFAKKTLKEKLVGFPSVDAAGGALSADDVEAVEGEASKPVIRNKQRHMFDLSFKIKFQFKWMDTSGRRSVAGTIEVSDFTNDTFAEGALVAPVVQCSFKEGRALEAGRRQAVEEKLGITAWPPQKGSLLADTAAKMAAFEQEYQQVS